MSSSASSPASLPATLLLPLILLLFFASGCAALIYEVVWYQLLALAIGSSAISLGILLATFMGGLCLGSYFLPKLTRPSQHPLKVYAVIEFGIGVFGLLVLWGLPIVDGFYIAGVQGGMPGMLMRGLLAALMLLPPTFLMGASLPAISRFISATPRGVTWWGWLYAGNTIGAVLGCMLAGFWLLRLHDQAVATYAAVLINFVTAGLSFALAQASPATSLSLDDKSETATAASGDAEEAGGNAAVYWAIGISGAAALGSQVVWTRYLAMLFGQTVYAFSAILAVFLAGIAIGGGIGALLVRWIKPRAALAWSQVLLAGAIAYAAFIINRVLPWMPEMRTLNGWEMAFTDVQRAGMAILPGALLWGASFPFALAAAGRGSSDPAGPVARVYAANTFGAIIGALSASLLLIGWIGSHVTQQIMLVLVALGGLVLLVPMVRRQGVIIAVSAAVAMAAVGVLAWTLPRQPGEMIAFGHQIPSLSPYAQVIETSEGRTSSIAITRVQDGHLQISVGGHVEATTIPFDMSLQRMIGHIPALLHPNPQKVLGIGFGAGVSAGSFTFHPAVKSITVVELEPKVPPISHKYFGTPFNNNVRTDPRTRLIFDDGRHFMMTTKETFDIIASDPIDVWVKGTAGIYSTDYFRKVKERLNPGGYFTLYVPLYESSEETLRTEFATFFEVFPNGTIWANLANGYGYDLVLMGPKDPGPIKIDIDLMEQRLRQPQYAPLAQSMNFIGFPNATEMYATYLGDADSMREWLKGAQLNTDRNMRLQYIAGWAIHSNLSDPLYRKMLGMRQIPRPYFTGSPEALGNLYRRMYAPQSGQSWPAQ